MPLAWRKPHNARTDAPGGAPRDAQHLHGADGARRRPSPGRPNEWTIRELAEEIGMPQPTLYTWVQKGRLPCRSAGPAAMRANGARADPEPVAALKAIRAPPPHWRQTPPRIESTHPSPTTES